MQTRRSFLKTAFLAGATIAVTHRQLASGQTKERTGNRLPWYRRVLRWGQTNITEIDPQRYDIKWWRQHWKRTGTQGVVINAGGIVAYYPSDVPLHRQAKHLEGRDLFGELCRAAQEDGIAVFARMDSNRAHQECYDTHPDWFAVDGEGKPHKAGELFVACINSPYYEEHIPAILGEIADRYHPEGFTDNSWSGLGRGSPCFCKNCEESFQRLTGKALPRVKNWKDGLYQEWIRWNYERRLAIWDLNNRVTKSAGGPECIWVGMNSGSITGQCQSFRDYRQISKRAEMIMLDHQSRSDASGFQHNGHTGKLIHELLGWDKLIPESMAMYQAGKPTFRLASKPVAEARAWMLDGIAGGVQPWWHHVGAYHEDRRMYETAGPVYLWHQHQQEYLVNRQPIATVGVIWSQQNHDFFGRDDSELVTELPFQGIWQALVRSRIPYLPVHAEDLESNASRFSALILPNFGAISDRQVQILRNYVNKGGGLLATGQSTLFNERGEPRPDFALADLFGVHLGDTREMLEETLRRTRAQETLHTYLRLRPELRAGVDGPHVTDEPKADARRHPVLRGLEKTDILPFGGSLDALRVDDDAEVLATFVPQFPIYPPETAWMREPRTEIPALVTRSVNGSGRVAFLTADLDRRFSRDNLPDHGNLLRNLVRWVAEENIPLSVQGAGLIDCHLYSQSAERLILHLVNLTSAGTWRQPVDETIAVGPLQIRLRLPQGVTGNTVKLLVAGSKLRAKRRSGWVEFSVPSVLAHEVVVVS